MDRANWAPFRVHDRFVDRPRRSCAASDLGFQSIRISPQAQFQKLRFPCAVIASGVAVTITPCSVNSSASSAMLMSYQDIADHVGLTIETVSRTISDMERSKMVTRVSTRRLLLQNRLAFGHMMN